MSDNFPFLTLELPCDEAINWVVEQIESAGLKVICTFDLRVARHAHVSCPCPHHGTDQCNCQMVVLLVYGSARQPVSIIAHNHDERTWFSLVDTPQQRADHHVEAAIRQALVLRVVTTHMDQISQSHAS